MQWLEITISTVPAGIETVASALTAAGFSDLLIEDQQEFQEFLEDNRAYWDYIDETLEKSLQGLSQIKLYLEDTDQVGLSRLQQLLQSLREKDPALGALPCNITTLPDTDWEEAWKDNYPPQEIGEKLVVLPYWLADTYAGDRLPVILDPGLTFGTGAHPSTQMVIAAMEELLKPRGSCLDLGSGSGILSLVALRLGAATAIGVDIDPKAEDIARENAAYNGISAPQFTALTGNVLTDKKLMEDLTSRHYDLVLVNIVADVIIALSSVLPKLLHEDSTLILSGILDTRLPDVLEALDRVGLTVTNIRAQEDWRCVTGKLRGSIPQNLRGKKV